MGEGLQEVKIIGVDKEGIKMSTDQKEYWFVPFDLSLTPDESWQNKFYDIQRKDRDGMKRKTLIVRNSMRVEVAVDDDLQHVLNVLKKEVVDANALYEEDRQKKIKIRHELEALQQKQRDLTLKFKDDSEKLVF